MLTIAQQTILAIDFDHTIADIVKFPTINGLRKDAKKYINLLFDEGFYLKINTCRSGVNEQMAIDFLRKEGINYHLINDNNQQLIDFYGDNCRKISADIYIDDKNIDALINPQLLEWETIYNNIHKIVSNENYRSQLSYLS